MLTHELLLYYLDDAFKLSFLIKMKKKQQPKILFSWCWQVCYI